MNSPLQSPSDLSPLSVLLAVHEHADPRLAFEHALALVVSTRGELELVDVRGKKLREEEYLGVREVLESWNRLPPGSSRDDVGRIGIRVKKIVKEGDEEREIGRRLQRHDHDLMVVATGEREGLAAVLKRDVGAHLAESFGQTALYVPAASRPCIDRRTGEMALRRILVPIAAEPASEEAVESAQRMAALMGSHAPAVIAVHWGDDASLLDVVKGRGESWSSRLISDGAASVPVAIADLARDERVDLIVMSTNGRSTLAERFMGSITEQVIRRSPCPVLAVAVK